MTKQAMWIGPSIMTADLLHLGDQISEAEQAGIDYLHLDVMDGSFVPNISFGLPVASAVRRATSRPLDVHLMIVEPEKYVEQFAKAGADLITVHVEACRHLHSTITAITKTGAVPCVALNPATPLVFLEDVLPMLGQVLLMSVNPGFGGQTFIPFVLQKIRRLREMIDQLDLSCRLQVDGGVNASNIRAVSSAGADMIVAGSAIYHQGQSVSESVRALRTAL